MPKRLARDYKPSLRAAGIALSRTIADITSCMQGPGAVRGAGMEGPRNLAEMPKRKLISIVEDDPPFRQSMVKLLTSFGHVVEAFPSAAEFLASPLLTKTACLVTDVHMPGMTGVQLYKHLAEAGYAIPTILVTAYPDEVARSRALKDGVVCYLCKPVDDDHLERCLRSALQP